MATSTQLAVRIMQHPELADVRDVSALAKSYLELVGLVKDGNVVVRSTRTGHRIEAKNPDRASAKRKRSTWVPSVPTILSTNFKLDMIAAEVDQ